MKFSAGNIGQVLALVLIILSSIIAVLVFVLARGDHDMKLLALGAAISQGTAMMATASTMLVGKSFDSKASVNPADLPPGSVTTNQETVQTPPINSKPSPSATS